MNAANLSVYFTSIHGKLAIDITMILSTFFHDGICNTSMSLWVVGGRLIYDQKNSRVGHMVSPALILGTCATEN